MVDDDDDVETTMTSGSIPALDPARELNAILDDLEFLLKAGEVIEILSSKGVNASLALVGVQGLRSLLRGDKAAAEDDFATLAEEMRARRADDAAKRGKKPRNGRGT
jgi:hypothetical protein